MTQGAGQSVPVLTCTVAWCRLVRSYPSGWQIYLQREGQQQPELLTELVRGQHHQAPMCMAILLTCILMTSMRAGEAAVLQGAGAATAGHRGLKRWQNMGATNTVRVCFQQRLAGPQAIAVLVAGMCYSQWCQEWVVQCCSMPTFDLSCKIMDAPPCGTPLTSGLIARAHPAHHACLA